MIKPTASMGSMQTTLNLVHSQNPGLLLKQHPGGAGAAPTAMPSSALLTRRFGGGGAASASGSAAPFATGSDGGDPSGSHDDGMGGQTLRVLKRLVPKEAEATLREQVLQEYANVLVCEECLEESQALGVSSQTAKFNRVFEDRFFELLVFHKAYGHMHVPKLYPDNPPLGRWVVKVRSWKKKNDPRLTPSRLRRLDEVVRAQKCRVWMWCALLLCVVERFADFQLFVHLHVDQGFIWEPKNHQDFWKVQGSNRKAEDLWETNFAELLLYKDEYGTCLVPKEFKPNQRLARWVTKQRKHHKAKYEGRYHSLDDDKERRLIDVGFVFNTKTKELMRDSVLRRYEDRWEEFCEKLAEFKREFGHTAVPRRWKRDPQLASWVMRQVKKTSWRAFGSGVRKTTIELAHLTAVLPVAFLSSIVLQRFQWRKMQHGEHSYLTNARLERLEEIGFVFGEIDRKNYPVGKIEDGEDDSVNPDDEEDALDDDGIEEDAGGNAGGEAGGDGALKPAASSAGTKLSLKTAKDTSKRPPKRPMTKAKPKIAAKGTRKVPARQASAKKPPYGDEPKSDDEAMADGAKVDDGGKPAAQEVVSELPAATSVEESKAADEPAAAGGNEPAAEDSTTAHVEPKAGVKKAPSGAAAAAEVAAAEEAAEAPEKVEPAVELGAAAAAPEEEKEDEEPPVESFAHFVSACYDEAVGKGLESIAIREGDQLE
jgi:Helicase associated domain